MNGPEDYVQDGITFDVHVRLHHGHPDLVPVYEGFVYLQSEIVFRLAEPASSTPAGIEDFAGVTMRTFARRLSTLLAAAPPSGDKHNAE